MNEVSLWNLGPHSQRRLDGERPGSIGRLCVTEACLSLHASVPPSPFSLCALSAAGSILARVL
jgi:hypothetical protein